jgi:hypothetical protein
MNKFIIDKFPPIKKKFTMTSGHKNDPEYQWFKK